MQAHLEYESLEKLHVPRPVDRLDYIAGCCVGRTVLDIGCFDETALEKRGTEYWLHGRILEKAVQVTGIDISDKLPEQGLETGANGRILRRQDIARLDTILHAFLTGPRQPGFLRRDSSEPSG